MDANSPETGLSRYPSQLRYAEEGSESTTVNGDKGSERLASELGPGCQSLEGTRNVNIESLYEVSTTFSPEGAVLSGTVRLASWSLADLAPT